MRRVAVICEPIDLDELAVLTDAIRKVWPVAVCYTSYAGVGFLIDDGVEHVVDELPTARRVLIRAGVNPDEAHASTVDQERERRHLSPVQWTRKTFDPDEVRRAAADAL